MRRFIGRITFCATILLTLSGTMQPSLAQSADDLRTCQYNIKTDPDEQIRACSIFIRTRRAVGGRPAPAIGLAGIFSLRGLAHARKYEYDLAIEDYDQALQIYPKAYFVYGQRGYAYFQRHEYGRALNDMDKAISLVTDKTNLAENYANRGSLYTNQHDYNRALSDYGQAIQSDPKLAAAYHGRGYIYKILGDEERAIADYKIADQLDPASRQRNEDSRKLHAHWLAYLKEIQDDKDYANWSGPPLDLYRRPNAPASDVPNPQRDESCALAATHWTSAESIGTLMAYEDHLARFPNCTFSGLAKARISAIKQRGAN